MTVGALCNREVIFTEQETSIAEAARLMRRFHVGDLVIVAAGDAKRPIGLVTDRDLVLEVLALGLDPEAVTVADIMTRALQTVTEETELWDALSQMRHNGVRRMPVVSQTGALQGIFTLDDALELVTEGLTGLVALVAREIDQERATRPER